MEDSHLSTLIYSILALPVVFGILYWVKIRRDIRRNESGEVEYTSVAQAIGFLVVEGLTVVASLAIMIAAVSGIVRYIIITYA
ncbi:hypothetical protein [Nitrosomonas mobilis]|uniref:Transmembrane protein n=1 Tax=Nitrosomonas mobilis TaxID=51642 RepID=A0A1G5SGK8_9PROT|nr:hypothetical protein [Nitrosomonas mobilis]SCZ86258.1 conserved hypothetical protein [Nitrosomonas mobilis]HNO74208.1 hypothetical protein [Nitrosomonas mobilis]